MLQLNNTGKSVHSYNLHDDNLTVKLKKCTYSLMLKSHCGEFIIQNVFVYLQKNLCTKLFTAELTKEMKQSTVHQQESGDTEILFGQKKKRKTNRMKKLFKYWLRHNHQDILLYIYLYAHIYIKTKLCIMYNIKKTLRESILHICLYTSSSLEGHRKW